MIAKIILTINTSNTSQPSIKNIHFQKCYQNEYLWFGLKIKKIHFKSAIKMNICGLV